MTFISYAQNYEDVMLWRALKHIEKGFYIDIGAAWPEEHSVTYSFYINGWHGINIEPNQKFFDQLAAKRPSDINLPLAIGEKSGSATMYFFGETGLSTLDKDVAHIHKEKGRECIERQIDIYTLNSIFEKHIPENQEVHFLKVDVEGLEKSVLKGNNWKRFRPWIVLVEATLPLSQSESHHEWENIIISAGYLYAYADGLNRYYVAKEHSELINSFKYPPNVFDEFILASQQSAEEQTSEANARAQTATTRAQTAEARAQQLTNELHSVYNSRSWRVTKPLRDVGAFLHTVLRKRGAK